MSTIWHHTQGWRSRQLRVRLVQDISDCSIVWACHGLFVHSFGSSKQHAAMQQYWQLLLVHIYIYIIYTQYRSLYIISHPTVLFVVQNTYCRVFCGFQPVPEFPQPKSTFIDPPDQWWILEENRAEVSLPCSCKVAYCPQCHYLKSLVALQLPRDLGVLPKPCWTQKVAPLAPLAVRICCFPRVMLESKNVMQNRGVKVTGWNVVLSST